MISEYVQIALMYFPDNGITVNIIVLMWVLKKTRKIKVTTIFKKHHPPV